MNIVSKQLQKKGLAIYNGISKGRIFFNIENFRISFWSTFARINQNYVLQ